PCGRGQRWAGQDRQARSRGDASPEHLSAAHLLLFELPPELDLLVFVVLHLPSLGRRNVNEAILRRVRRESNERLRSVTRSSPLGQRVMLGRMAAGFDGAGRWLKCALHAHTTNSD